MQGGTHTHASGICMDLLFVHRFAIPWRMTSTKELVRRCNFLSSLQFVLFTGYLNDKNRRTFVSVWHVPELIKLIRKISEGFSEHIYSDTRFFNSCEKMIEVFQRDGKRDGCCAKLFGSSVFFCAKNWKSWLLCSLLDKRKVMTDFRDVNGEPKDWSRTTMWVTQQN